MEEVEVHISSENNKRTMDSNTPQSEVTDCAETSNQNTRNSSRWWVKMDIQGRKFSCFLDSASGRTIMRSVAYSLAEENKIPLKVAEHNLTLGTCTKKVIFLIMPTLTKIHILRGDLTKEFKIVLYFHKNYIQVVPIDVGSIEVQEGQTGLSLSFAEQIQEVNKLFGKLVPLGSKSAIAPSNNEWASPIVLVHTDYCQINKVSNGDAYPLPYMEQTLHSLQKSQKFLNILDLLLSFMLRFIVTISTGLILSCQKSIKSNSILI